jgi:hypothetical protein
VPHKTDGHSYSAGSDQLGTGLSDGIAWGDYDNDGDLDLAVAKSGQNKLYRNNKNGIDWIKVKVIGGKRGVGTQGSNRAGIGAKVKVYDQNKQQLLGYREISAGSGYRSMNALEAHFGVPPQGNTYHVEVYWPTSGITTDTLVTAPAVITVHESTEASPIPMLSQLGMIITVIVLIGSGLYLMRRRRILKKI